MVSNQVLGARVSAGLLIAAVALAACSHSPPREEAAPSTSAQTMPSAAVASPAESDMTATEAAVEVRASGYAPWEWRALQSA